MGMCRLSCSCTEIGLESFKDFCCLPNVKTVLMLILLWRVTLEPGIGRFWNSRLEHVCGICKMRARVSTELQ